MEQSTTLLQDLNVAPKQAVVDLGYRGKDVDRANPDLEIIHRGRIKTMTNAQRRWLKRRQAVEPAIGHLKSDNRMQRCWLQGETGDALHALCCAVGYNLRWLMRAVVRLGLRGLLLCPFWLAYWARLALKMPTQGAIDVYGELRQSGFTPVLIGARFWKMNFAGPTKYFKYGGRFLLVLGVMLDAISIVQANKPLRRATEVISAWALASIGCRTVGAGGAWAGMAAGSEFPVVGNAVGSAIGGVGGCIIGGVGGYWSGEKIAGIVYDWAEDTIFTPLYPSNAFEADPLELFR